MAKLQYYLCHHRINRYFLSHHLYNTQCTPLDNNYIALLYVCAHMNSNTPEKNQFIPSAYIPVEEEPYL